MPYNSLDELLKDSKPAGESLRTTMPLLDVRDLDRQIKEQTAPTENVPQQVVSKEMLPSVGAPDKTKEQQKEYDTFKAINRHINVQKVKEANKEADIQNRINKNVALNSKQYDLTPEDITEIGRLTRDKYEKDYNDRIKGLVTDKAIGFEVGGQNHALRNMYEEEDLQNAANAYVGSALGNQTALENKKNEFEKLVKAKQLNERLSGIAPKISVEQETKDMFNSWLKNETKGYETRKELDVEKYFDENGKPNDEFKKSVYEIAGGDPKKFKDAAKELLNLQYNKFEQGKSVAEQHTEGMQNWMASNLPPAYWLYRNYQGLRKGSEAVASTIHGIKNALLYNEPYGQSVEESKKAIEQSNTGLKPATKAGFINESVGSAAETLGEITSLGKILPFSTKLFSSEGAVSKYLPEIKNKFVRESASGLANRMDDVLETTKLFGVQTYNDRIQQYHEMGYSWDEAKKKAATYTAANMVVLSALPKIIHGDEKAMKDVVNDIVSPKNIQLKDKIFQYLKKGNEAGMVMGASNILTEFDTHLKEKELGLKDQNETFSLSNATENAVKPYLSGFIFGVAAHAISPQGLFSNESPQTEAITKALSDRKGFQDEVQQMVVNKQISSEQGLSLLQSMNTIADYRKQGIEKGLEGNNATQYATAKAKYDLLNKAVTQLEKTPNADKNKLNNLQQRRAEAAQDVRQIENGTYLKGKVISSVEMAKIAKQTQPTYEKPTLTKERKKLITRNAPYVQQKISLETLKTDENVAKNLRILENKEALQHNVAAYDKVQEEINLIEQAHNEIKGVRDAIPMSEKDDNRLKELKKQRSDIDNNLQQVGGVDKVREMLDYNDDANNGHIVVGREGQVLNGSKQAATRLFNGDKTGNVVRSTTEAENKILEDKDLAPELKKDLDKQELTYEEKKKALDDDLEKQLEENKDYLDEIADKGGNETIRQKLYKEHANKVAELTKKEFKKQQPTPEAPKQEPIIAEKEVSANIEAKPFEKRTDAEHKAVIQDKFRKEFTNLTPEEQDASLAIMEARAKASGQGDKWYRQIEDIGNGEFQPTSIKALKQVDAYHGSPHDFEKFTTEKIGTGEGAQAFGWGLYFTDLKGIAEGYAEKLTDKNQNQEALDVFKKIQEEILPEDFSGDETVALYAIDKLKSIVRNEKFEEPAWLNKRKLSDNQLIEADKIVEKYKSKLLQINLANLYKVTLHEGKTPEQYTWLEWDKPITKEQADKIKSKLQKDKHWIVDRTYENEQSKGQRVNGQRVYSDLSILFGSDKEASKFLLKAGIDGVKYPAESVARGATSDNARGFNYVVFDENAVKINEKIKFQENKGALETLANGRKVIHAFKAHDFSTAVHEMAHIFEDELTEAQRSIVNKWAKTKEWTTETSEAFARGFERYLREGKAPTEELKGIFQKAKEWLSTIYKTLKGSAIEKKLSPEVREVFDSLFKGEQKPVEEVKPSEAWDKDVESTAKVLDLSIYEPEKLKTIGAKEKEIPNVYFHGTNNDKIVFDKDTIFYGTKDEDFASTYGEKLIPTVIELKNPYDASNNENGYILQENGEPYTDKEGYPYSYSYLDSYIKTKLKERGFDGVKVDNSVVAFEKNQVKSLSEAYHKAKSDGSNPELVKAVESLLGKPQKQVKPEREQRETAQDLYDKYIEEGMTDYKAKKELLNDSIILEGIYHKLNLANRYTKYEKKC